MVSYGGDGRKGWSVGEIRVGYDPREGDSSYAPRDPEIPGSIASLRGQSGAPVHARSLEGKHLLARAHVLVWRLGHPRGGGLCSGPVCQPAQMAPCA